MPVKLVVGRHYSDKVRLLEPRFKRWTFQRAERWALRRADAVVAQGFEGFGAEVRGSYQRVVEAGGKEFENLLKSLDLTSQQEGVIRQKAISEAASSFQ